MKTFSKLTLCLVLSLGIVFETSAQNILVSGKVTAPDGTAIMGVHIFDSISKTGTTSDKYGAFVLNIPERGAQLRFSHIGFNTKYLPLTLKMLSDTISAHTIWLDVELTQRVKELPAAAISDSKVQIAWEDPKQWILDYELVGEDEMLLLLIQRNKRYLQLVNSSQEKISQIPLDHNYNELYKDCFGYFHLLSKDSACQVFLADEEFVFDHLFTRADFYRVIKPVVVNTGKHLYIKSSNTNGQKVFYDKIDTETKEMTPFIEHFDELQARYNSDKVSKIISEFVNYHENVPELLTPERIAAFHYILINSKDINDMLSQKMLIAPLSIPFSPNLVFYKQILSIPPYSLLAKINDSLYFFDHLNGKIAAYDLEGDFLKETPINYHKNRRWGKEIIVNEERTRCFAKFTNVGETTLRELDPNTGKFLRSIVLEQHAFPSKIRIRGNYIYYRCRDIYEGEDRYFLWKQRIE